MVFCLIFDQQQARFHSKGLSPCLVEQSPCMPHIVCVRSAPNVLGFMTEFMGGFSESLGRCPRFKATICHDQSTGTVALSRVV